MKKTPKIPLVIGAVFVVALTIVIVTTIALRKELIHEESIQLTGKYKDLFGATIVGSDRNLCHEI